MLESESGLFSHAAVDCEKKTDSQKKSLTQKVSSC